MIQKRSSLKHSSSDVREKLRRDCKEIGRQQRKQLLQQHRHSLSPSDLQAKLHAGSMAAIKAQLNSPGNKDGRLTDADIEVLLHNIEQQVLQEIQQELTELERSEHQDRQRANDMAEEHMQFLQGAAAGADALFCPVCRRGHLFYRHGFLVCPSEGWQLSLAAESLQLEDVRKRLEAAYMNHIATGCSGQLLFHIEDLFGSQSLTCGCTKCHAFVVVV